MQVYSGRFVCFACGAWGYWSAVWWREEQQRQRPLEGRLPAAPTPSPVTTATFQVASGSVRPPSADLHAPRAPAPRRPDLAYQLAAFQAALPRSRGTAYLQQRGIPLALAQQHGVGYAGPGTWPHATRDWRGAAWSFRIPPGWSPGEPVRRAVGPEAQVPKAKRHDHLPGAKGYFNAGAAGRDRTAVGMRRCF